MVNFRKSRLLISNTVLRSEIPSGMCAKLRTVAASNNIIMLAISLTIACLRYIYNGVILHAHPVRDESHNQRNTTREVATRDSYLFKIFLLGIHINLNYIQTSTQQLIFKSRLISCGNYVSLAFHNVESKIL